MLTFTDYGIHSATVYADVTREEWSRLCVALNTDPTLEEVYFHYTDYHQRDTDLLSALANAQNLKSVLIKGSTFTFLPSGTQYHDMGLISLIKGLESCPNLEHIQIRNYSSAELTGVYESLVHLMKHNPKFKKLTFWHQDIDNPDFKLLCDFLAQPGRAIELNLQFDLKISFENQQRLKEAMQSNKDLVVTGSLAALLKNVVDEDEAIKLIRTMPENTSVTAALVTVKAVSKRHDTSQEVSTNINMDLLNGFISVLGIGAVAIAFMFLSAATLNIPGLILAGFGVGALVSSMGLFAFNHSKSDEGSQSPSNGLSPAF
jgi:hypothetical protein